MPDLTPRSKAAKWLAALFFLAGIAMAHGYSAWDKPLLVDTQHYFFIAERAAAGVPPHISQVDPKNALSMFLSATAIRIGRIAGLDDVRSTRVVSVLAAAGAVTLTWLLVYELTGSTLAACFGALALLGCWGLFHEASMGNRPKVFVAFFMLLAHWAAARNRTALAGIGAASAFLCWQPGALVIVALGAAALLRPRPLKTAAVFATAAAVPVVLYELYFIAHGVLTEQLFQAYVMPATTGASTPPLLETVQLLLTTGRARIGLQSVVPAVTAAAVAALWLALAEKPREILSRARREPDWTALAIALHMAIAFTFHDNQAYPDLLLVQPYMALVAGTALAWIVDRSRSHELRAPARATAGAITLLLTIPIAFDLERYGQHNDSLQRQYGLGRIVGLYLEQYESVWSVGCTHLLAMNHVDNHVSYGLFFDDVRALLEDNYRPKRGGKLPEVILASRGMYPGARRWMDRLYVNVTPEAFDEAEIRVLMQRRVLQ